VPVHYLGVVSLGLYWQLNKDVSFSELVPNLASVPNKVMNIILNMKTEQFEKIFDDWLKRCKKCVELNGDYVEKRYHLFMYVRTRVVRKVRGLFQ
jgi:hypothetical protein